MLLEVLDGKTDVLALIVGWLPFADWKALSAANKYAARSQLRRLVFSQCVLRLPPPAPLPKPAASSSSSSKSTSTASSSASKVAIVSPLRVPWSAYVAGCFLRGADPQMLACVSSVRIPYSCLNLLEMLRFLPSLRAVRFWAYPYETPEEHYHSHKHRPGAACSAGRDLAEDEPAINVAALCQLAPSLRELHAVDMDVALAELPALQQSLVRLEMLDLSISDMDEVPPPLGTLDNLKWLSLRRTNVIDLAFLEELTNLIHLDVSETRATDFWPLHTLHKLESLNVSRNWVASASFLAELSALRTLKMTNVGAMDPLSLPLAAATHLETLQVQGTRLSDIEFVRQTPELKYLDIRWTETTDRRPIASLHQLERLLFDVISTAGGLGMGREVVAIGGGDAGEEGGVAAIGGGFELASDWLRSLRNLKKLRVYRRDDFEEDPVAFEDLDDQQQQEQLQQEQEQQQVGRQQQQQAAVQTALEVRRVDGSFLLDIASAELKSVDLPALVDYTPLGFLSSTLRHLNLQQWTTDDLQRIAALSAAGELQALRRLSLALPPTPIHEMVDLQPLEGFVQLTQLELIDVLFEELSPLSALTALEKLDLSLAHRGKRLVARRHVRHHTTFDFLARLEELQELTLTGRVDFKDASVLSGLVKMRKLWLGATKVEDVGPLAGLTSLEQLDLSSTPVTNVDALETLEKLEEVWLPDVADCKVFQGGSTGEGASKFRRLHAIWHPDDYNCLWTDHKF
jgi:Leucine-rich repeat (LRR) protein